jgi:hypothetical protein
VIPFDKPTLSTLHIRENPIYNYINLIRTFYRWP